MPRCLKFQVARQLLVSLTNVRPKPMIPLGGKPLLEHNLRLLARYQIREIAFYLHYHAEMIVNYFGDGSRFGVEILLSRTSASRHRRRR